MSVQIIAATGAKWLWEEFGKNLINKTLGAIKDQWAKFHWQDAEEKYRQRMRELYSTTRILGNPKPIVIDNIFTDVYTLDLPSSFKRFDIEELQSRK